MEWISVGAGIVLKRSTLYSAAFPNCPGFRELQAGIIELIIRNKCDYMGAIETNNKLIVREYIEKVLNAGDVSLADQYISPDYTKVYNNHRFKVGIEGAKEHITGVRKTYPDINLTISQQICEGE